MEKVSLGVRSSVPASEALIYKAIARFKFDYQAIIKTLLLIMSHVRHFLQWCISCKTFLTGICLNLFFENIHQPMDGLDWLVGCLQNVSWANFKHLINLKYLRGLHDITKCLRYIIMMAVAAQKILIVTTANLAWKIKNRYLKIDNQISSWEGISINLNIYLPVSIKL